MVNKYQNPSHLYSAGEICRRYVGGFEVAMMSSKFESHETANDAALLTQRCTNGDLLAFSASYVQTGFENYSSRQSAGVLAIAIN